jgi:transcriptional regulator with XRE-family HTH domain
MTKVLGEFATQPALPRWTFSRATRFFFERRPGRSDANPDTASELPAEDGLPSVLISSGRELLGLSQEQLHVLGGVSKKVINDYENELRPQNPEITARLRAALEQAGARFVRGNGFVGVVTELDRDAAMRRSRDRKARAESGPSLGKRRGRPRKEDVASA